MPARRLPWIKFWLESLDHDKVALLSDAQFRTWLIVLCKGSEQPVRWRFASAQHAAAVAHRPLQQVKHLIGRRLLDEREDGVWVHDWKQWQEFYASDLPLKGRAQRSVRTPPTLRERSDKTSSTLPVLARAPAKRGEGEERPETGEEETGDRNVLREGEPVAAGEGLGGSALRAPAAAPSRSLEVVIRFRELLDGAAGWDPSESDLGAIGAYAAAHGLDLDVEGRTIRDWLGTRAGQGRRCTVRWVLSWLKREVREMATPRAVGPSNGAVSSTRGSSRARHG